MKILRKEIIVIEDSEPKLKQRVIDNFKKKKKQSIKVDVIIKDIPEWGEKSIFYKNTTTKTLEY